MNNMINVDWQYLDPSVHIRAEAAEYRENFQIYIPEKNIIRAINSLPKYSIDQSAIPAQKVKKVVKSTNSYMQNTFASHPISIYNCRFPKGVYESSDALIDQLSNLHFFIDNIQDGKNPYDLPVVMAHDIESKVLDNTIVIDDKYKQFFYAIIAGVNSGNKLESSLIHERMHTLVDGISGAIENPVFCEVLEMLAELIYAAYKDDNEQTSFYGENAYFILADTLVESINYLDDSTQFLMFDQLKEDALYGYEEAQQFFEECFDLTAHYISGLIAFKLFDIFLNEDAAGKFEMINNINKIIEGRETLDMFLERYQVSLDETMQESYSLCKRLSRKIR